jgi:hypothetical protein
VPCRASPENDGGEGRVCGRIIVLMGRWLSRRGKRTQAELAELERVRREAKKNRHRAEAEIALRNAHVEGYLDRHPPDEFLR